MRTRLRKLISATVIGCYGATVLAQDPQSEGVAAGNSANVFIRGMLNQPTATSVLPPGYYNSNPSETALYNTTELERCDRRPCRLLQQRRSSRRHHMPSN